MYARILVPVDGSAAAQRGLDEAIRIAAGQGGQIRLLHIVNEFILDYTYSPELYATNVVEMLRTNGRAVLDQAAEAVRRKGITVDAVLVEAIGGAAADRILEQAREWPADLVVMGTHGRRGLARLVMGSDAEQVLRGAAIPVLLVRPDSAPGATARPPGQPAT